MSYSILIEKSAQKSLAKIPQPFHNRIIESIWSLADNPRPHGGKKLTGREAWRIRIGDYRVIYEIHDEKLVILVIIIGHRKDVYRGK
jgi:mRNA interferase RelE/StbE